MPSNSSNQPVKDETPWYKRPLSSYDLSFSKIAHSWKRLMNKKKSKQGTFVKKNIKDIRSKPVNDGTDGLGVENPEILDIDLIKDEVPIVFDKKKNLYTLGAFVILSLFLVFEIYFFLYSWERQEISKKALALQDEISRLDKEIASSRSQALDATEFKNQINSAGPVFANHVYWTNFFSFLEKNTLTDVYYSSFAGDTNGTYVLRSLAKDFRAVSFQLKTVLADSHISDAKISNEKVGGSDQSPEVIFDFGLSVKPGIFTE